METFCLEPLALKYNFLATFISGYKKPNKKPKKYTYINFLKVASCMVSIKLFFLWTDL